MAKRNCSAITFSGSSYAWAKCSCSKGGFAISSNGELGDIPHSPQISEEDTNQTALAEYQKELAFYKKKISSKISENNVLSVPTSRLLFKTTSFPSTDLSEIQMMVLSEFESQSPAPIDEMVVSFDVLEEKDGSTRVIYAAAKEEDVINQLQYIDITPKKVNSVDANIMGLLRNLVDAKHLPLDERTVILAREGEFLTMVVADGIIPCSIRHIGNANAISNFSLLSGINNTIRQVNSEFSKKDITKLIFVDLQNTPVILQNEKIKQTIKATDNLVVVELYTSDKTSKDSTTLPLTSVGIAKRSFEKGKINLFPNSWTAALQQQKAKIRNFALLTLIAMLWIYLMLYQYLYPNVILEGRIKEANKNSELLRPAANEVQEFINCVNIINQYSNRSHSPLEILREISICMPEGIVITQFRYKGTEKKLQIEGRADSPSIVYLFKDSLADSKLFGESFLKGPTESRTLNKHVFELDIIISNETADASTGGN